MKVKTYGRTSLFQGLFKSRRGWVKVWTPVGNLNLSEEEE